MSRRVSKDMQTTAPQPAAPQTTVPQTTAPRLPRTGAVRR